MRNYLFRLMIILIFIPMTAMAGPAAGQGIGDLANQMIAPVSVLSDFVSTAAMIIGVGCIFGGFLRYNQYRINPMAAPLSTVIILFVLGLVLLAMPFMGMFFGADSFLH